MKIIVERFTLTQKLGGEDQVVAAQLLFNFGSVAHGNRGFYYHRGLRINTHHITNNKLHRLRVEAICAWVVICRGGDHHKISTLIGLTRIEGCS